MSALQHLYRRTIFFTLVNAIEALTPLALIPILTRFLAPEEYGVWGLYQAAVAVILPLIGLGFRDAIRMHFLDFNHWQLMRYLNGVALVIAMLALTMTFMLLVFQAPIASWLKVNWQGTATMVVMASLSAFLSIILALCQFSDERGAFVRLHLLQTAISISVSVGLVMSGAGWQGCVFGKIAGLSAANVAGVIFLIRKFEWSPAIQIERSQLVELARFHFGYLGFGVLLVAAPLTGRIYVANLLGIAETGYFAIASSFAMVLFLYVNGFIHAWLPWLFRRLAKSTDLLRPDLGLPLLLFCLSLPLAALTLDFVAQMALPYVVSKSFARAGDYILPMLMATAAQGLFLLVQGFVHFRKKTSVMSFCAMAVILLNAILSWYWTQAYGVVGTAQAIAVSYLCAAIVGVIFVFRLFRVPEERAYEG